MLSHEIAAIKKAAGGTNQFEGEWLSNMQGDVGSLEYIDVDVNGSSNEEKVLDIREDVRDLADLDFIEDFEQTDLVSFIFGRAFVHMSACYRFKCC